ncbi:DUF2306 domain-containing protein [Nonomuraea sp. H19]|uniref:DUF2306 domain-containing protein n=1 Tax=Nonomuraea sp. H19 TaxID=3452206 RepID=UPI003F8AC8F5
MGALALVSFAFLAFSLPPYLTLDPSQSRFPIRDDFAPHYPLMVTHIFFGTVALLASCVQVSTWMRQRYPAVHRWSGRAYVLGGVPLVGVPALIIAPLSHNGFGAQVGNTFWAFLWLFSTIAGYRMARQRRFADHQAWMIRSFALIWAIVLNRLWAVLCVLPLIPQLDTTFGGDQQAMIQAAAGPSIWLSIVVNLIIAEWWLQRRGAAKRRARILPPPA